MVVGSLALLGAACGAGSTSQAALGSPADPGTAGLRAAATAWSHAFLTGNVIDIRNLEGAQCLSTPAVDAAMGAGLLAATRTLMMERHLDAPLASIRITGVQLRNVTATTGEAEVQYALPAGVAGSDNWVQYGYQDGQWKVTNCRPPIGGESSSSYNLLR